MKNLCIALILVAIHSLGIFAVPLAKGGSNECARRNAGKPLVEICETCCELPVCFFKSYQSCYHYIQCHKLAAGMPPLALHRPCGLGTLFQTGFSCSLEWTEKNVAEQCKNNENKCKKDGNAFTYGFANGDDEQCGQYFECDGENDTPIPKCCPEGQAYKDGSCKEDSSCPKSRCPEKYRPKPMVNESMENTTKPVEPCLDTPVPGTGMQKYNHRVNERTFELACSPGTIFDNTDGVCACVYDVNYVRPQEGCTLRAVAKFDGKHRENKYLYIDFGSVATEMGTFSGDTDSYIRMWHFENNDNLGKQFTIAFVFKDHSRTSNYSHSLISTCRSERVQPSLAVKVNSGQLLFSVVPHTTELVADSVEFSIEYNKATWNFVIFTFDGKKLQAEVIPLKTATEKISMVPAENIKRGSAYLSTDPDKTVTLAKQNGPLTVGSCIGDSKKSFVGDVKLLKVYNDICNNKEDIEKLVV